uniref:LT Slt70-like protein n=1 Tax=Dulem virus 34 TaxID=3145752 RepID=A0AAU8B522_9CAUD
MSQRAEKYARRMERRVDKLEQRVLKIETGQISQGIRISSLEDDLAVYQSAVFARDLKRAAADTEARRKEREKRQERERRRTKTAARIAVCTLLAVLLAIVVAKAEHCRNAAEMQQEPEGTQVEPYGVNDLADIAPAETWPEDPLEAEKIEEALLEQGYFSLAVPLPFEYQDYMRTYCAAYGCPYPLALAVAEIESNFDMDAIGTAGEVGIMQLNPGPSGTYHAELQAATGMDPTTPSGNIAGGCYKLGKYLAEYGDAEKAAMAYNMGAAGAKRAWEAGITSTDYSAAVMEAMEKWECTVNAWDGV